MLPANLLTYFEATQYAGRLPHATHHLIAGSKHQGRWVAMDLQVTAGKIVDVRYRVYGCAYTIALTEYLAQHLLHQSLDCLQYWQWPVEIITEIPHHKHSVLLLLQRLLDLEPTVD